MSRKQPRARHWLYPLLAYFTVVVMVVALLLRPSWLFLYVVVSITCIMALLSVHHLREKRVPKDTYIEYVLVLIAVIFVLCSVLKH